MLNEIQLEGAVVKTWAFGEARFARIACHPDPGRTLKRNDGEEPDPEYITLRFEPPLAMAAATLRDGQRVRASGYLASREYDIPLTRFAERAVGDEEGIKALQGLAGQHGDKVRKPHVLNEVVAERFVTL